MIQLKKTAQGVFSLQAHAAPKTAEPLQLVTVSYKVRRLSEQQLSNIRFNLLHDSNRRAAEYLAKRKLTH